jgi:predicted amino acid racemase
MGAPCISVDIEKIEENTRAVTGLCAEYGISVTGVTKATCGMPQVAHAMIRGGIASIGESRMENIHRLRAGGLTRPVVLLRIPPLSAAEEIVRGVDVSLNSEISVIRRLDQVAENIGIVHKIILMVDLGDLREGILPEDLIPTVREIREMPGIAIGGIGTNLTCYGGVIPTEKNLQQLVDLTRKVEDTFNFKVEIISGGNSSSLPLLAQGKMPRGINNLRIGEAILLGRETVNRSPWPGTSQKTFMLSAELIELKKKPSIPQGETGQDAFGHTPVFEDKGERIRGILNIGREDVDVDGLEPEDEGITIMGASSDHLLVDLTEAKRTYKLGAELRFHPTYSALLMSMTSNYVEKKVLLPPHLEETRQKEALLVGPTFREEAYNRALREGLLRLGYHIVDLPNSADPDEVGAFMKKHTVPIISGPDYTLGGLKAAAQAMVQFGLLWVDSTIEPEELKKVLARNDTQISSALSLENIVIVGPREIPAESVELIKRYRITSYTMEEISLLNMREVLRLALNRVCSGTEGIYVKFAGRVADKGNDGLTNRETHLIMEMVAASRTLRIIEIDDTENPEDDSGSIRHSREASANLPRFLLSAMGKRILGDTSIGDVV